MATETVNESPNASSDAPHTVQVISGTALEPREYLQWLLSIESASDIPNGTRAYLVSIDHEGKRRLRPVEESSSVLDIRRNLKSHLQEGMFGPEFFTDLRAFCDDKLSAWLASSMLVTGRRLELCAAGLHELVNVLDVLDDQLAGADATLQNRTRALRKGAAALCFAVLDGLTDPDVTEGDLSEHIALEKLV